jgi:hypothetical protein
VLATSDDTTIILDCEATEASIQMERRCSGRFALDRWLTARLIVKPNYQPQLAIVRDLAVGGIGLIVLQVLEPGSTVAIQLRGTQTAFESILVGEVRHVTWRAEGFWLLGCRLSRNLSEEEIQSILHNVPEESLFN